MNSNEKTILSDDDLENVTGGVSARRAILSGNKNNITGANALMSGEKSKASKLGTVGINNPNSSSRKGISC
ncbi:MAG: hypothetical protein K6E33_07405 [Lachnospiraceae bacterium]|nr:hypothetical protein [Lachnospiraceae bacterium]